MIYLLVLMALILALAYSLRAVYVSVREEQIVQVFQNNTAEPQTAQMLSDESGLSIEQVDKALTGLNRTHRLRRIGMGSTPHYLYIPHPRLPGGSTQKR